MKFEKLYRQELTKNRFIVCSKTVDGKFCLTQQIKVDGENGPNYYFLKNSLMFDDIESFEEFIDGLKDEALVNAKKLASEAPE